MSHVASYGCVTAAGCSVLELWDTLQSGRDCSKDLKFLFRDRRGNDLDMLTSQLLCAFREMKERAPLPAVERLRTGQFGVILASTKGRINDFIWQPSAEQLTEDPLTPLLTRMLQATELKPTRHCVVSNACSSGLAAARLGQLWLKQGLSDVLIFAADAVSDFVKNGFTALKLISNQRPRPFAQDRNGFLLGEAAAALWLCAGEGEGPFALSVGIDSEGSAVTRPAQSGDSLVRAALLLPKLREAPPEIVLAHGTGTLINDQTEDLALQRLFANVQAPLVTGSKWAIGHTLAASAVVDVILACEMLKRRATFPLHTTQAIDPAFTGRYLVRGMEAPPVARVMVSSLGFGGMHAAALVEARL